VEAASDGAEHGATFTIRLPRLLAPLDLARDEPEHTPPERSLRILVVDDNVDAANMLAHWLSLEGHRVAVAHDGPAALDRASRERFEAFILDIGLPGMDGTELARRLRTSGLAAGALLVALTGYGQQADRDKSAAAGFDHHLVKPADPQLLRSVLARRPRAAASVP
jgi:CheY-like chemotaxis protein